LPLQEVAAHMKVMHERVAGIDVHKDMVKVAIRSPGDKPWTRKTEILEFRTFFGVLRHMAAGLRRRGVTHVVMEASGVSSASTSNGPSTVKQYRRLAPSTTDNQRRAASKSATSSRGVRATRSRNDSAALSVAVAYTWRSYDTARSLQIRTPAAACPEITLGIGHRHERAPIILFGMAPPGKLRRPISDT